MQIDLTVHLLVGLALRDPFEDDERPSPHLQRLHHVLIAVSVARLEARHWDAHFGEHRAVRSYQHLAFDVGGDAVDRMELVDHEIAQRAPGRHDHPRARGEDGGGDEGGKHGQKTITPTLVLMATKVK